MARLTKAQRSELMSRIKSTGTGPEKALESILKKLRLTYEEHPEDLPGKPDFIVRHGWEKVAVFVHGCFWHCCPKHFKAPKTRAAHWKAHFAKNVARDKRARRVLRKIGYRTAVVWEHEVNTASKAAAAAARIARRLKGTNSR